jgi:hypothetical protein
MNSELVIEASPGKPIVETMNTITVFTTSAKASHMLGFDSQKCFLSLIDKTV